MLFKGLFIYNLFNGYVILIFYIDRNYYVVYR